MTTIIVGADSSKEAHRAVEKAANLASMYSLPLHIVTAAPAGTAVDISVGSDYWHFDDYDIAQQAVEALAGEFRSKLVVTTAVLRSDPVSALCDEATRLNAEVIVIGNKRVKGLARVLGSVAGGVAKSAPCDVFVVHTYS